MMRTLKDLGRHSREKIFSRSKDLAVWRASRETSNLAKIWRTSQKSIFNSYTILALNEKSGMNSSWVNTRDKLVSSGYKDFSLSVFDQLLTKLLVESTCLYHFVLAWLRLIYQWCELLEYVSLIVIRKVFQPRFNIGKAITLFEEGLRTSRHLILCLL